MSQLYTIHSIDIHRLQVKGQKKYTIKYQSKKAEVAILTSDKNEFQNKKITEPRKKFYI